MKNKDSKGELKPSIYLIIDQLKGYHKFQQSRPEIAKRYLESAKEKMDRLAGFITPKEEWISVKREDWEEIKSALYDDTHGYYSCQDILDKYESSPPTKDQTEKEKS